MRLLSVIIFLINKNKINKYDDIYCDSKRRHQSDDDACLQTPPHNGRACPQPMVPTTTAHNGLAPPSYHSCPDTKKSTAKFWIGTYPKLSGAAQICARLLRQLTINYNFSRESSSIIAERRGYCCCQSWTIVCTIDLPSG